MKQFLCSLSILLVMSSVGCSTFKNFKGMNKLAFSKPKLNKVTVGSADIPSSNKLKNPSKIHLAYASWHEQNANHVEARSEYLKVLEKNPKDLEAILGLARIDQLHEREEECDQFLEKALQYHPKDPRVFLAIGQTHAARKEWPPALENLKAAQKLAPFDPIYEYHLAVAEAEAGQIPAALEHFTRSVGLAEGHFNVSQILSEQGNIADAELHLVKALKLKPELKRAEAALAEIRSSKTDRVQPASFNDKSRR